MNEKIIANLLMFLIFLSFVFVTGFIVFYRGKEAK
ncbi:hypothetical protein SAMN06265339_0707 [Desulfurobacterium pacificum]|uniref:Uncharacterized protein n=1 Tax=Desulfurobacterium pacificum TaxID=240166 RepID=A0ABY1NHF0_9BACT|nr:hypothetical protein SAMN06265339_0707 [Desulfurobacterium pacificum]